jgi:uncharacterized protein (TIRG00374 family)
VPGKPVLQVLKWVVSIGLIALLLSRAELNGAVAAVKDARLATYGVGLSVMAVGLIVRSLKWRLLLEAQGSRVPVLRLFYIICVSIFFNNMFAGTLGGDAFRTYRALDYADSRGGAAMSVILDRATGLFMGLALVLVFGAGFAFTRPTLVSPKLMAALITVFLALPVAFYASFKLHSRIRVKFISDRFPRLRKVVGELATGLRVYKKHKRSFVLVLILSTLFHLIRGVTVYCFALSVNADVGLMPFLFIVPLVGLIVMIPISIHGIGIQEAAYVFYLEKIGLSDSAALLAAFLSRLAILIYSLIGGVLFAASSGRRGGIRRTPADLDT